MSGGSPTQNAVMLTLAVLIVAGIALWVVVRRVRWTRAVGSHEAGSVRSRGQAVEIADRLCTLREGRDGTPDGAAPPCRVEVRGAARLLAALREDGRFGVTARRRGEERWSFAVAAPGGGPVDDEEALGRRMVEVLGRNGVTAAVAHDAR